MDDPFKVLGVAVAAAELVQHARHNLNFIEDGHELRKEALKQTVALGEVLKSNLLIFGNGQLGDVQQGTLLAESWLSLLSCFHECVMVVDEFLLFLADYYRKHESSVSDHIIIDVKRVDVRTRRAKVTRLASTLRTRTIAYLNNTNLLDRAKDAGKWAITVTIDPEESIDEVIISKNRAQSEAQFLLLKTTSYQNFLVITEQYNPVDPSHSTFRDWLSSQDLCLRIMDRPSEAAMDADVCRLSVSEGNSEVVRNLSFPQVRERFENIAAAHAETFKWIYKEPNPPQHWSDFAAWLENGSGCYFIQGKAGSGKSTLCKYIWQQPETRSGLKRWAGSFELITASFYFWRLGTNIQKSQLGLLRALLMRLLRSQEGLIPFVLPKLLRNTLLGDAMPVEHYLNDLKLGLQHSIHLLSKRSKIFILIDGLDEYTGDLVQACDFFKDLAQNPHLKLVVSSRPLPIPMDVFSTDVGLRLQDLTSRDITNYSYAELRRSYRFRQLEQMEDGHKAKSLIGEITSRASGVFLWVTLVVKSLREGLQEFDSMEQLQSRLQKLPTELYDLFHHMLSTISPHHEFEAFRTISTLLRSLEVQTSTKLSALQLWFAEQSHKNSAVETFKEININLGRIDQDICATIEGRIRSCCRGLVEIQRHGDVQATQPLSVSTTVSFLHRTVEEFCNQSAVNEKLTRLLLEKDFDVDFALLFSIPYLMQNLIDCPIMTQDVHQVLIECLAYYVRVWEGKDVLRVKVLHHLDFVLSCLPRKNRWQETESRLLPCPFPCELASTSAILIGMAQLELTAQMTSCIAQVTALYSASERSRLLWVVILALFSTYHFVDYHGTIPFHSKLENDSFANLCHAVELLLQAKTIANSPSKYPRSLIRTLQRRWLQLVGISSDTAEIKRTWFWRSAVDHLGASNDELIIDMLCSTPWDLFLIHLSQLQPCFYEVPEHLQDQAVRLISLLKSFLKAGVDVHVTIQMELCDVFYMTRSINVLEILLSLFSKSILSTTRQPAGSYRALLTKGVSQSLQLILDKELKPNPEQETEIAHILAIAGSEDDEIPAGKKRSRDAKVADDEVDGNDDGHDLSGKRQMTAYTDYV